MTSQAEPKIRPRILRLRYIVAAAFVLALAYTLTGFLLAPWVVKRELPRLVEEKLHHRARIGEIAFNPFTLTLHASNFSLEEMDGRPVIGFSDATVRVAWRSMLRRAWVLSEVRLVNPSMHVEISKQGLLNLAALAPPGSGEASPQPTRFAIGHVLLENGSVDFVDEREGYRNRLERLSLELSSLSTLDQEASPYALAGETPNGTKLRWKGELSLLPMVASGTLAIENASLSELDAYLRAYFASLIVAGRADLELPYHFAITDGKLQFTLQGAKLAVHDLNIAGRGAKTSFCRIGQLALEGVDFDLQTRSTTVHMLQFADVGVDAKRNAKGELDLARFFAAPTSDSATAEAQGTEWRVEVGMGEITNITANFVDESAKEPLLVDVRGLHAKLKLDVDSGKHGVRVRVDRGEFGLAEAQAGAASWKRQAVRLADVVISGASFDSDTAALGIDAVRVGNLSVDAEMKDGNLSLLDLVPAAGGSKSGKPLMASVKSIELAGGSVKFADRSSRISLALERLGVKLKDISSDMSKPLAFELAAGVQSGGRIGARGRAVPAAGTLEAQVEVSGVALAPLQPLMAQYASVKLTAGEASLAGTLTAGGKSPRIRYAGSASVTNLALNDETGERLLGWKSLATSSLRFTLLPNRVEIDELRWNAPAGKLAIAIDHTTNIGRAFAHKDAAPTAQGDKNTTDGETAFAVEVRRVRVEQGELEFVDESLRPGFAAKIHDLEGIANGLSSDRSTRSQFTLEGRVGEFGFAHITGTVNPFALRDRTNFRVQFRNLDLTTVSTYSMKFAGYRIASGRMSLDLNYRVHDSILEGDDHITLDQFTLGERVESPDAFKLPIEFAIALLKDSDGRIDVAIPVSGNLDDPQFSYATLMWKAIGNLITSVVTAPFRALAHLFGGNGEEVGAIAFDPGASKLQLSEQEKLNHVIGVLAKRPELKLVIPARYDAEADARALRRAALSREIGRRAGFTVADDEDPGPINIEDRRTRAALRALFAERFSQAELDKLKAEVEAKEREAGAANGKLQPPLSIKDRVRNFASGEPQVADAREFYLTLVRRLRDAQPLPANALSELAQKRAAAIEDALKAAGADPARIALSTAEPTSNAEAKQVTLQLSLAKR
jgi:hypothetical protein